MEPIVSCDVNTIYDLAELPERVESRCILFSQGRAGGTLLQDLLNSHPQVMFFGEVLSKEYYDDDRLISKPHRYLDGLGKSVSSKVFGCKIKISHLVNDVSHEPAKFLVTCVKKGYRILYLNRRNILRQVLSNLIAENRRNYHYTQSKKLVIHPFKVDPDRLVDMINHRLALRNLEINALRDLPYLSIMYEDNLLDTKGQQTICDRIFEYLNIFNYPVKSKYQRINTVPIRVLMSNYNEIEDYLCKNSLDYLIEDDGVS